MNKETKNILIAGTIGILIWGALAYGLYTSGEPEGDLEFYIANASIESSLTFIEAPTSLIFTADDVHFSDGNLTLNFDNGLRFIDFEVIDYIEWNLRNETYRFYKESSPLNGSGN